VQLLFFKQGLEKYKLLGGKIIEGICVTQIEASSKSLLLNNGESITYDVLIGADGLMGVSSRYAGNVSIAKAFGVEVSVPTNQFIQTPQGITLDVGYLPDGYVWIFPKGLNTTIGLACSFKKDIDYANILRDYVSSKCHPELQYKIRGSFLPYGRHNIKITHSHAKLLLIGDAAGYTDCVTGEGIYFAIKSGVIAADTIIANYSRNLSNICSCYEKNCHTIVDLVNRSAQFMSFFYRNRELILKILKGHSRPLAFVCDHQVSQYDYKFELFKLIKDYFRQR